ncbi:MAG TPA: hypothetical protein EYP60_02980, partial [bacterium (Candidatus Stahlbacteria)]|nr:hypothetical protein [Candidatus Stahlbacteria bacterium]
MRHSKGKCTGIKSIVIASVLSLACLFSNYSLAWAIKPGHYIDGIDGGDDKCATDSLTTLQGFKIEFLGVDDNDDGTYTWTYKITSDGDRRTPALSHWTLALCDNAINTVVPGDSNTYTTIPSFDGHTGRSGI